jgi:tetratricopeptide (TPR) repeat protein
MRSGSIWLAAFMSVLSSSVLAEPTGDPNVIAYEQKSGAEAIASCTAAIQSGKYRGKQLADLHFNRDWEFGKAKDNDWANAAMADYSEAIRLAPDPAAFNNRGNIYRKQKNWRRALADYNDAIRLNPKYALALYSRGVVQGLIGRDAEYKADIARALAIDPSLDDPDPDEDW